MAPERSGEAAALAEEALVFTVVMEECDASCRPSGLMEILLINCTLPFEFVVVVDDDAPGFETAGLNVLQLDNRQKITISIGR